MARYLLIEFDDDAQADTLRAQIDAATAKGKKFRVVGLFGRPKRFCACVPDKTKMKDRVIRGPKLGWWVCRDCKRPRLGNHELRNLIEGEGLETTIVSEGVDYLEPSPRMRRWYFKPTTLSIAVMPKRP